MAIFLKAAQGEPVPPSRRTEIEVSEELDKVILACLARDPADRPQSARELSRRLAEVEARIGAWTPEQAENWWRLHLPEQKEVETIEIPRRVARVAVGT
jgi:serine/threonine-protein kinase